MLLFLKVNVNERHLEVCNTVRHHVFCSVTVQMSKKHYSVLMLAFVVYLNAIRGRVYLIS